MVERVNDDFSQSVSLLVDEVPWTASPTKGVARKMLDRVGGEVARATSVVRFLPGHVFPAHTHGGGEEGGGEEFLVLSGVFSDEQGDYSRLTYVRNAPGSSHAPFSDEGAQIFVKLRQMRPEGEVSLVVEPDQMAWCGDGLQQGHQQKLLFQARDWVEEVALECLEGEARLEEVFEFGAEILVLEGALLVAEVGQSGKGVSFEAVSHPVSVSHPALSWLRFPCHHRVVLEAKGSALYWIKRGVNFPV